MLVALHLERLLDNVVGKATLQVNVQQQGATSLPLTEWLKKPSSTLNETKNYG